MPSPLWSLCLLGWLSLGEAQAQSGIQRYIPPSPVPAGFIHDGGPVLTPGDLEDLNRRIEAHQAGGRGDIAVAILRDIGDYTANEIGLSIYRTWKVGSVDSIGSERRDLGALLLIVPKELSPSGTGDCYITTGVGAEGFITDAGAGTICRDTIIPYLVRREYAAAVRAGIEAIAAELTGIAAVETRGIRSDARPVDSPGGGGGGFPAPLIALLGVAGAGGSVVLWRKRKRRKPRLCPRGHGPMQLLDEKADDAVLRVGQAKEEELKSVDYDVWQCMEEDCGERLVLRYKRWFTSYSECPQCKFWTVKSKTRTLIPATTSTGGMAETTRTCQQCGFTDTRQHATPRLSSSSSSSSSSSGGSSSGGGRSFGGSGRSAGGGGGGRY
jgi:uncharacterized protein